MSNIRAPNDGSVRVTPVAERRSSPLRSATLALSGGAGEVRGDEVGRVPIEREACPVVAHGGARVGVRGGFVNVRKWDASVECGGDERVPQRVRPDGLVDTGTVGDLPHDPA